MKHSFHVYHGHVACFTCLHEWPRCDHYAWPMKPADCPRDAPLLTLKEMEESEKMRIAFTDGEMSNLSADFGQMLCACIVEYDPSNPRGRNLRTFTLSDYDNHRWNDRGLGIAWRDALEEYDIIVTWNGIKFDIPFLNTRLRRWKVRELRSPKHKDLLYTARFKLRLSSNSLDNVSKFLGCQVSKTKMDPEKWTEALGGKRASYNYILDHCRRDVRVLAEVWDKTKHLVTEIKSLVLPFLSLGVALWGAGIGA